MLEHHLALLGLLVGTQVFFTVLAVANVRHGDRAIREAEDWLVEDLDADDPDRIRRLHRADAGLSSLRSWFVVLAILLALYGGPFERLVDGLAAADVGVVAAGAGLFAALAAGYVVVVAPLAAFEAFVVRDLLGASRPSPSTWVLGQAVRATALLVGAGVAGGAVVAAATAWPDAWWLLGWGLVVLAAVVGQVFYPQLRHRVLDDPEPVTDGPAYDAVTEVFERAGAGRPDVYRTTGGAHASKMDAHVSGLGQGRVVLSDAMVEELSPEELQGVLAHELAHLTNGHLWKGLVGPAVQAAVATAMLGYLVDAAWAYEMFGLGMGATHAGLALALAWTYPVVRLTAPLRNAPTVAYERRADAFAREVLGDPEPLRSALERISGGLLIDPFPHRLYVLFHYTHPPIPARLRALRRESATADGRRE